MLKFKLDMAARASAGFALVLLGAGCASTPPEAEFVNKPTAAVVVQKSDTVNVGVNAADGVTMPDLERQRMTQLLQTALATKQSLNATGPSPLPYQLDLQVTRYDEGSAVGRALLIGVGQIHLEGTVTLYTLPDHSQLEQFKVSKDFAFGGIYGATTTMADIEKALAEGIANTVTGRTSDDSQAQAGKT
jgi:hypothetical protein